MFLPGITVEKYGWLNRIRLGTAVVDGQPMRFHHESGVAFSMGVAGGPHDPDTGFVHFGFGDYHPDTGRPDIQ